MNVTLKVDRTFAMVDRGAMVWIAAASARRYECGTFSVQQVGFYCTRLERSFW